MTCPYDVFKGYIFQSVTKSDFPCQKGSLLVYFCKLVSMVLKMEIINKIPFGLRESDQSYVDVADVLKGKQCGCICPSCKTPLQARQGKVRNWYFAHASKRVSDLTEKECDYSFWVSVLLMAKEAIRQGGKLKTPGCSKFLGHDELIVTDPREIDIMNPEIEQKGFDAYFNLGKYSIGVIFSTPEKPCREIIDPDKKTGILEISLASSNKLFYSEDRKFDYKTILRNIIFKDEFNKKWLYHPKIEFYKNKYGARLTDKPPFNIQAIVGDLIAIKHNFHKCDHCNIRWKGQPRCPDCQNKGVEVQWYENVR